MKKWFSFFILVMLVGISEASIEAVIFPGAGSQSIDIRRWAVFRAGNEVRYGKCDTLEAECNPDTESLEVLRTMSYEKYLTQLANRFRVPPKYLIQHEQAMASYEKYLKQVTALKDNQSVELQTQINAETRFNLLTQKEGVFDRFVQAVAIKRALEWAKTPEERAALATRFGALNSSLWKELGQDAGPSLMGFLSFVENERKASRAEQKLATKLKPWVTVLADQALGRTAIASYTPGLLRGGAIGQGEADKLQQLIRQSVSSRRVDSEVWEFRASYDKLEHLTADYRDTLKALDNREDVPAVPSVVTYEKSVKQFEQVLAPINFAFPRKNPDPKRMDEPSTGFTWVLVGSAMSYLDAHKACQALGGDFGMPRAAHLAYSGGWLGESPLADLIPGKEGFLKSVWIAGSIEELRKHQGKTSKFLTPQSLNPVTVDFFYSSFRFPAAWLGKSGPTTYTEISTTEQDSLSESDRIAKYGGASIPQANYRGGLCVGSTPF